MNSTYTYAVLEISPEAHAEIKEKLLAAGYSDQIHGDTIDMQGIAVKPKSAEVAESRAVLDMPCCPRRRRTCEVAQRGFNYFHCSTCDVCFAVRYESIVMGE